MSNKAKYVLDTSILFENIKQKEDLVTKTLDQETGPRRYCLYYSLIEFRLGLVQSWVVYYLEVLATQDIQSSIIKISNAFSGRDKSYKLILEKLMVQLHESIENRNIDIYLGQVEACIFYAQESISLIVNKYIGSYEEHPLLSLEVDTAESYEEFKKYCKDHSIVDIKTLVESRKQTFTKLVSNLKKIQYKGEDAKRADTVIQLVDEALANPARCNMPSKNRKYGDIVIAVDTPSNYKIVSEDTVFRILGDGLSKEILITNFK